MLKHHQHVNQAKTVSLEDAVERYGKKRSHDGVEMMSGVEHTGVAAVTPPRKKPRGLPPHLSAANAAAPLSPLPSPNGTPPPEPMWPSASTSGSSSPTGDQPPIQPDLAFTALLTLPSMLNHFTSLPQPLQSHYLLTLLRHSPLPVLRTLHSVLTPTLARDFLTLLPAELVSLILSHLHFSTLARASRVSKSWRHIVDSDEILWRTQLKTNGLWFGGESERAFTENIISRRFRHWQGPSSTLPLPHPYKMLFKSRYLTRKRWPDNPEPKHNSFAAHGSSVVTCLIFSHGRIISASDDHSIHVYSPVTGELLRSLDGHEGGVWALAATKDILVSGSTDRTVRIWDLKTGRCKHVFGGHTSTVRCLAIVKPEMVDVEKPDGTTTRERWPKRPLIVTGSRDHTLRVWTLPKNNDREYKCSEDTDEPAEDAAGNPYHLLHLEGHDHAVRALAARGRTLVSGSYDCTVRIWDIITGECKWVLSGHTQKVYSVVMDPTRNQACSGSMDGTVRIWNLKDGQCQHTLTGHTSLVGLLGISPSFLVSAAADSTLRVWDIDTGELQHTLAAHTGAITCFQHDEFKVLSGSDGTLKMWNIRDGSPVRDLLTGITGVWQVVFEGRWCVAASNRNDTTVLDVWDFGVEEDEDWVGEPPGWMYDDEMWSGDEEDEQMGGLDSVPSDEEQEQADVDAMDQDLLPSDVESIMGMEDDDGESELADELGNLRTSSIRQGSVLSTTSASPSARSGAHRSLGEGSCRKVSRTNAAAGSSSRRGAEDDSEPPGALLRRHVLESGLDNPSPRRSLPSNDETPTRPRHHRSTGARRR